jgi:aminopeptidase N
MVQPLLQQWLSAKPKEELTIIDLPETEDSPSQQGNAFLTSLSSDAPEKLAPQLAYSLAHVYFQSPRTWLNEGVAAFAESLWIEHTHDRDLALQTLDANRGALAFAEPVTPGTGPGQDLLHASDAVYYRTKATYVLWMLRDVAGDKQLAGALQDYDPAADTTPEYFEHLVERPSGIDPAKDLKWFFNNWVYQDRGLPDLSIAAVHSSTAAQNSEYLVGIDILNDGFAEAEVPITVRSQNGTLTERVRLPGKTRTAHRMLVQGTPMEVIVNDGTVPEIQATIHSRAAADQPAQ